MLSVVRSLAIYIVGAAFLASCRPTVEERLIGSWDAPAIDASNRITLNADHTFEGQSDGMGGIVTFRGTWHLAGDQLAIRYDGEENPISQTVTKITSDEMILEDGQGKKAFPWKRIR